MQSDRLPMFREVTTDVSLYRNDIHPSNFAIESDQKLIEILSRDVNQIKLDRFRLSTYAFLRFSPSACAFMMMKNGGETFTNNLFE